MKKQPFPVVVFALYYALLIRVMVFKGLPIIRTGHVMLNFGGTDTGPSNFVPFKTIIPYLLGNKGLVIAGTNLVGNVALLVPIGLLAPFVFRNMMWKKSLALAIAAGLSFELMQALFRVGIFDVDDIILNALGVMVGYWTFTILVRWVRARKYKNIVIAAIIVTAVFVGTLYAVFPRGNRAEGAISKRGSLCGGTPGTGQIIKMGNNAITIKRNDGAIQTIKLTGQTMVRSSAGLIPESDLKIGDHVTLVVYGNDTATTVLVCNISV